jgi:hypothetical protein
MERKMASTKYVFPVDACWLVPLMQIEKFGSFTSAGVIEEKPHRSSDDP